MAIKAAVGEQGYFPVSNDTRKCTGGDTKKCTTFVAVGSRFERRREA